MKKIIITIAAVLLAFEGYSQLQPNQLDEISQFNNGDVMIIQQTDGIVRKFDYNFLESQIIPDELDLYWDSTEVKTYTNDNFLFLDNTRDSIYQYEQDSGLLREADIYWQKSGNYVYNLNDSIGIGTSIPTEKLDINGNIKVNTVDANHITLKGQSNSLGGNALYLNDGTQNNAVGESALRGNNSSFSNAFGHDALYKNSGDYNIGIGHIVGNIGQNGISGSHNILMGNNTTLDTAILNYTTVIGSNNIATNNYDVILGYDQSNFEIDFDTTHINNYLKAPSGDHEHYIASYARRDTLNYATANTWVTPKFDTIFESETTSAGFSLAADSTGTIVHFDGILEFGGHAHIKNNGNTQSETVYFRLMKNGVEQSRFNTANTRSWQNDAFIDIVSADGFVSVSKGDSITIQYRATSADFDLESTNGGVFDNTIPLTVWFKQGITKK